MPLPSRLPRRRRRKDATPRELGPFTAGAWTWVGCALSRSKVEEEHLRLRHPRLPTCVQGLEPHQCHRCRESPETRFPVVGVGVVFSRYSFFIPTMWTRTFSIGQLIQCISKIQRRVGQTRAQETKCWTRTAGVQKSASQGATILLFDLLCSRVDSFDFMRPGILLHTSNFFKST